MMTLSIIVLQLLIFFTGIADFLPTFSSANHETRTFRWTSNLDMNDTSCARAFPLENKSNATSIYSWENTDGYFLRFSGFSSPESRRAQCQSNASIFMLVGNPGIVWHPETGQCVKTKLKTETVSGEQPNVVRITFKALSASHECERDDPSVARFKFDKNNPHRLSFMGDIDTKTGKQEEWCIRNWVGSLLEVLPRCDSYNPFTNFTLHEVYFQEIV